MTQPAFLGIDFGTAMTKAAVAIEPNTPPERLALAAEDPFLPCAVDLSAASGPADIGWSAYQKRRNTDAQITWAFRNRLKQLDELLPAGQQFQGSVDLHRMFFTDLGRRVQMSCPDVAAVTISVPDAWTHDFWALPVAVHAAGWQPACYLRESTAVMALLDEVPSQEQLVISLGFSAARATWWVCEDSQWQLKETTVEEGISGQALRERLREYVAEKSIRQHRRDPREDAETDWQLHQAIDLALQSFQSQQKPVVNFSPSPFSISPTDISNAIEDWPARFARLIERSEHFASKKPDKRLTIVVWGELVPFLPLEKWSPADVSIKTLPIDAVALGAASVCAWQHNHRDNLHTLQAVSALESSSGRFLRQQGAVEQIGTTVPVLEALPTAFWPRQTLPMLRLMLPQGGEECVRITTDQFRFGRHPDCEWIFDQDIYPHVSQQHAQIERREDTYILHDLGSTNHTYVNDEIITEKVLHHGDTIRLGQDHPIFRFEWVERP